MKYSVLLFALVFTLNVNYSQTRTYVTQQLIGDAPRIDGYDTDQAWNQIDWTGDFIQTEPYDSISPTFETEFKLLYDENNLYIIAHAYDSSPDSIVSWLERRDNSNADWLSFRFDSYNDKQTAFVFTITAAGVQEDQKITNSVNWDINWNAIWESSTIIDNTGWWAEVRIPLTQLRYNNEKGQEWGMQVKRKIFRYDEVSQWQYRSVNASTVVDYFGHLIGLNYINAKKQLELAPYVLVQTDLFEAEQANLLTNGTDVTYNAGVDAKIGITNDFTLDATINPDFGQVEADPSEVNLGVFETVQAERRTFFVEGNNILQKQLSPGQWGLSDDNIFYSRRIGRRPHISLSDDDYDYVKNPTGTRILGAFKVSGKNKEGLSLGVLESVTREEIGYYQINGVKKKAVVEPITNYFVSSISKDFNKGNTQLSGIICATNRMHEYNDTLVPNLLEIRKSAYTGLTSLKKYFFNRTYFLTATLFASSVNGSKEAMLATQTNSAHYFQRPDDNINLDSNAVNLKGWGGTVAFEKGGSGNSVFNFWVTARSPGLELNDAGYLRETDHIQQRLWYRFRILEPRRFYRKLFIDLNDWTGLDYQGRKLYFGVNPYVEIQFKNFWNYRHGISLNTPGYSNNALRGGERLRYEGNWEMYMGADSDQRKKLTFSYNMFLQRGFNSYYETNDFSLYSRYRPIKALSISLIPRYNNYRANDFYVSEIENTQSHYVMSELEQNTVSMEIRLSLNLSPKMSIDYYGMPFLSVGHYKKFKYLNNPLAENASERFPQFEENVIEFNPDNNQFTVLFPSGESLSFDNPNYKTKEYKSNVVFKWEYRPGSYFYLVWSQYRNDYNSERTYYNHSSEDFRTIFSIAPQNTFVVKLSYLLSR